MYVSYRSRRLYAVRPSNQLRRALLAVDLQPHVPPFPGLFVTLEDPVHLGHFREPFARLRFLVVVAKADEGNVREDISLGRDGEQSATNHRRRVTHSHLCSI